MHPCRTAFVGLFLFLFLLHELGGAQERTPEDAGSALGTAREALSIAPDDEGRIRLDDVLRRFEELTDWTLAMDEGTRRLVEESSLFVTGPIEAQPHEVARTVDALLSALEYRWVVVRDEAPRVLGLHSMVTTARATVRESAPFVPVEELARYEDFDALLVQTLLPLPNLDVRTMSNSMRSLVVDPNLLQLIPLGNTSAILLTGSGRALSDLVAMLRTADASSVPDAEPVPPASRPAPVPTASEAVVLPAGQDQPTSLLELLRLYARATGQVAVLNEETQRLVAREGVGLGRTVEVPPADVAPFVEALLAERGYLVGELLREGPRLVEILSTSTTARSTARSGARYVDVGSLDTLRRRPATLFMTALELPHVDVRTLSNSMRSVVVDPNLLQVVPLGNTSWLLLQGRGEALTDLVEMLRRVDAAEAARPPAEPAPEEEAEGAEDR